jgi:hypothetical protein
LLFRRHTPYTSARRFTNILSVNVPGCDWQYLPGHSTAFSINGCNLTLELRQFLQVRLFCMTLFFSALGAASSCFPGDYVRRRQHPEQYRE